ncbi:alpha/beta hydrolase [Flavisolibacter tropicus]|uniref:Hydrolase n=1 Tax=Flavisolibacter tropicus TaxID=1492898 RepID=A0A172TVJ2_9BACT|nr:alpha/beta hydrolase [Flavisolibacter tropicus]ANE50803.1 hydrolase [Flavisolibacter tropicus]
MKDLPIKNVVLVHGAFADGSGWESVYHILTKQGYTVRAVANPNTSFDADVEATIQVLAQLSGPVILVGHSYGGAVITEAGNAPNVAGLVYIAAFVPEANETFLSLFQSWPPAPNSGFLPPDENGLCWYDRAKFHSGFCADLPADKAAFMADSHPPLAGSVFGNSVSQAAWRNKPSWFVLATEDQTIPPEAQRSMAQRAKAEITELKASHVVFMSQPQAVVQVIEAAAEGALNRQQVLQQEAASDSGSVS